MVKFYRCKHCGNIIIKVKDSTVPVVCCGEQMVELVAGTVEASHEKHIPVYDVSENLVSVKVGEVAHPMLNEHLIEFIVLETNKGYQVKHLKPGEEPQAVFSLTNDEKVLSVYEYCNLHGLWKA